MTADELTILFQDDDLVVIDKPSGLLVHRSNIDRHETRFALQMLRNQIDQKLYPVHRLDKPSSGVLVFARTSEMAGRLSEVFASDDTVKSYLLLCRGYLDNEGVIDKPLKKQHDFKARGVDRRSNTVAETLPEQPAITHYRCLKRLEFMQQVDRYPSSRYSLALAQIRTGRKHQIRRHFKHISHPLIGDSNYGKSIHNRYFARQFGCHRLLLHAIGLSFSHPTSGRRLNITAPLTGEFGNLLSATDCNTVVETLIEELAHSSH